MRAEDLRALLRRQPFVPFHIHLTDGTTFDVRQPEMMFLTRSWAEIGWEAQEGSGVADRVTFCSLLHIVRIEQLDGKPGAQP